MDLSVISKALVEHTNRMEFDEWILLNESELANFFYKSNGQLFSDLGFHDFYFGEFLPSVVYQDYHSQRNLSKPFSVFLELISSATEKLALYGNAAPAQSIVSDLPNSAVKFRLEAINLFASVDDIRTSYILNFPDILEWLDKSRVDFEEGNLRTILDVVIGFYKKAKISLESKNLPNVMMQLKALFKKQALIDVYPFLENPVIIDLLNDKDTFSLLLNDFSRDCLEPSKIVKSLFNEINTDYFNHPKINHDKDNLWGHSKKYILDYILVRGRGDYTTNSGIISTDDKVLLYCFYNLKKHYFTSYGVFQRVILSLSGFFDNDEYIPTFIDLGCGPMTSGLAIGDLINTQKNCPIDLHYIGIDISEAMINKSRSFEKLQFFSSNCTFHYYDNWSNIEYVKIYSRGVNHPIIFNASYLFASDSVEPDNLAKTVNIFSSNFSNVFFVFQNPNRIDRNIKYVEFKRYIRFELILRDEEIIYYKPASSISQEEVYYEILKVLPL